MKPTSKRPHHAVIFCKPNCRPCELTKAYYKDVVAADLDLKFYSSVFTCSKDSVFRVIYGLDKFPTLLILDEDGKETDRLVGGQNIREILHGLLRAVRSSARDDS